jgi:hypothetical protein
MGGFFGELYGDEEWIENAFYGTDLVTLFLVVPMMIASLVQTLKGSERARLVWMGLLGYTAYNYAFYLFGAQFNPLFLVYVALFSLSIYALVLVVSATDIKALGHRFDSHTPRKLVSLFLLLVSLPLGIFELSQCLGYLFTGKLPQVPSLIFALDLSIIVPTTALSAVLLWRRHPWGYVLGAIMLVKAFTYGMGLILSTAFVAGFSASGTWDPLLPFYVFVAVGGLLSGLALLRHLKPQTS